MCRPTLFASMIEILKFPTFCPFRNRRRWRIMKKQNAFCSFSGSKHERHGSRAWSSPWVTGAGGRLRCWRLWWGRHLELHSAKKRPPWLGLWKNTSKTKPFWKELANVKQILRLIQILYIFLGGIVCHDCCTGLAKNWWLWGNALFLSNLRIHWYLYRNTIWFHLIRIALQVLPLSPLSLWMQRNTQNTCIQSRVYNHIQPLRRHAACQDDRFRCRSVGM